MVPGATGWRKEFLALNVATASAAPGTFPALVLNADYRPLSYYPLSLWGWQDAVKAVFLDRVNIVSLYDTTVRSPTFEIRLPVLGEVVATAQAPDAHDTSAQRILVVDDNEDAANTLAMILKMEGHEVDTAYSGTEALARIAEFEPAVVLLDIGLPGIDGFETARLIRARTRGRKIRLVAITGYGQEADRARTRDAGFTHHLVKPVDFADLKRVLATSN